MATKTDWINRRGQAHKAKLVVGEKFGRLGNRLWLFAHVVAHGIEHHLEVVNPCFDEYSPYFALGERGLVCRYPERKSLWNPGVKARSLSYRLFARAIYRLQKRQTSSATYQIVQTPVNEIYNLSDEDFGRIVAIKRYVILSGWRFRDYPSFEKHSEEIRHIFRPSYEIEESVSRRLVDARENAEVLIGVHIRQTDYKDFLNGAYYFDTSAYVEMMCRMKEFFPGRRVNFLICSDERQEPSDFLNLNWVYGSGHPVEDMFLLAGCDYILGPPSTFTMWASFYGKVPLYKIKKSDGSLSPEAFQITGGHFDVDADRV